MRATAVSKVLIDQATDRVTLGLTGNDGDIEITVPVASISTLAASLDCDRELAVHLDIDTAKLALACLDRVRFIHAAL
jgi:hypothetical protein